MQDVSVHDNKLISCCFLSRIAKLDWRLRYVLTDDVGLRQPFYNRSEVSLMRMFFYRKVAILHHFMFPKLPCNGCVHSYKKLARLTSQCRCSWSIGDLKLLSLHLRLQ